MHLPVSMRTHTIHGGDSVELYVEESADSDDPAVLFLHGYSQSRLSWKKQFESSLVDNYRLVRVDNRGHGSSEKPRNEDAYSSSSLWAADVHAVLDVLNLQDVIIVAWSYGSLIALDYLDVHGTDRIAGVNFVGVVSGMGTDSATELLGPRYLELFPDLTSRDVESSIAALEALVEHSVYADLSPDERYFMLGYNVIVPPPARDGMRLRTLSHRDTLASLDVPVLFTHGNEDHIMRPEAASVNANLVTDARTSMYSNVGHSPFWEAPNRFNRELADFVHDTRVSDSAG